MSLTDTLDDTLARYDILVRAQLQRVLDAHAHNGPSDFYGILRYHLGFADEQLRPVDAPHGKGLRAALLLLVAECSGGDAAAAAPAAAAIELLHNFSLIHDDIEDGSRTRRHRPTVWTLWGAPLGINAGDAMYALAHLSLFDAPLMQRDPARFIAVTRQFEQACLRLCEGQHRDMRFEQTLDVPVEDYLRMIGGKSASLIATACSLGALSAGSAAAPLFYRFGYELGMAFQMQDDVLGIWGHEGTTGKSASSDITSRKKTLPILLALEHAAPVDKDRLRALYAQPSEREEDTAEIMDLLDAAGARGLAQDYRQRYWESALDALAGSPLDAAGQERLRAFGHMFVERTA